MDIEQIQIELQNRCKEVDKRINQLDEGKRKQFQTAIYELEKISTDLRTKTEGMWKLNILSERPYHQRLIKERNKNIFFVCLSSILLFTLLLYFEGIWGKLTFEQASSVALLVCVLAINQVRQGANIELLGLSLRRFELQDQIDSLKLRARRFYKTEPDELDFDAYKAKSAWHEAITKSRDDGPLFEIYVNEGFLRQYLDLKERLLTEFFEK